MAVGAFLPLAIFILVAGTVGFRLLTLWHTTRERPEMLLGLGLLLMSCVAIPLCAAGRLPSLAGEPLGKASFSAGIFAVAGGLVMVVAFTKEVFRARSGAFTAVIAAVAVSASAAAGWISWVNYSGATLEEIMPRMRPASLSLMGILGACFLWSACESLAYYLPMKRRLALGLADPVVANRFLLWGLAAGGNVALIGVIMACMQMGMVIIREPIPLVAIATIGCLMSSAWYLTFFPPARYEQFIRARSANPSHIG